MKQVLIVIAVCLLAGQAWAAPIEPTWASMAEHYQVPDWLRINGDAVDGSRQWTIYGKAPAEIITNPEHLPDQPVVVFRIAKK